MCVRAVCLLFLGWWSLCCVNGQMLPPPEIQLLSLSEGRQLTINWLQPPPPLDDGTGVAERFSIEIFTSTLDCNAPVPTVSIEARGDESEALSGPLEEFSNITVIVTAIDDMGLRNSSEPAFIQTPSSAPTGPPQGLAAVRIDSTTVEVTWEPVDCLQRNSLITGYSVSYIIPDFPGGNTFIEDFIPEVNGRRFSPNGLVPDAPYEFTVVAVNNFGQASPPAMAVVAPSSFNTPSVEPPSLTLPRQPSSVRVTSITSTNAVIEWTLREPFDSFCPETFRVEYISEQTSTGGPSLSQPIVATASQQTYSVGLTFLQPDTEYAFYIILSNCNIRDEITGPHFFRTNTIGYGGRITNLNARSSDDNTTLAISWDPPPAPVIDPESVVFDYVIVVIDLRNNMTVTSSTVRNTTESVVTGLAPGVPYDVIVTPVSSFFGPGEPNSAIFFTQELMPMGFPEMVSISRSASTPTVMVVMWAPLNLSEARGFISHYTVAYTPIASTEQQASSRKRQASPSNTRTVRVSGMNSSMVRIEGLDPNTDYNVQVSATNGAGTSALSPAVVATPRSDLNNIGIAAGVLFGITAVLSCILFSIWCLCHSEPDSTGGPKKLAN